MATTTASSPQTVNSALPSEPRTLANASVPGRNVVGNPLSQKSPQPPPDPRSQDAKKPTSGGTIMNGAKLTNEQIGAISGLEVPIEHVGVRGVAILSEEQRIQAINLRRIEYAALNGFPFELDLKTKQPYVNLPLLDKRIDQALGGAGFPSMVYGLDAQKAANAVETRRPFYFAFFNQTPSAPFTDFPRPPGSKSSNS